MTLSSLQTVRAIAEAVVRDGRDDLEVTAILPGEAHGTYAEVLLVRRRPEAEPVRMVIGIARDLSELAIRQSFAAKLRARP
jgi:hypothetical protein